MTAAAHTAARPSRSETPEQRYLRHIRAAAIVLAVAAVAACALVAVLLVTVRTQDAHMEGQLDRANNSLNGIQLQG